MNRPAATDWPWPAPEDDGGARHLVRGLVLPDIALPATRWSGDAPPSMAPAASPPPGGEGSGVGVGGGGAGGVDSLDLPTANLARRPGSSVIFVYPWTGRPGYADPPDWDHIAGAHGSTPEAEGFRDHHRPFKLRDIAVFGLSGQDTAHHAELAERLRLPYALLSDSDLAFARALRLPTFATGGVTYLKRLTLVIEDGRIRETFYPVHPPHRAALDVLAWHFVGL